MVVFANPCSTESSIILIGYCQDGQNGSISALKDVGRGGCIGLNGELFDSLIYLSIGALSMRGLDDRSRMNREIHVRFWEGLRGKFPRPTQLTSVAQLQISPKPSAKSRKS